MIVGMEASISGSSQGRMEASNRVKFSFHCARMIWFLGSMLKVVNIECPTIDLQISFLEKTFHYVMDFRKEIKV
jgi:hypothetical protein